MLSVDVLGYAAVCAPVTGGISRVWTFDPADLDWTQATPGAVYSAAALMAGATTATGGGFREIKFDYLEGQLKSAMTRKNSSIKWNHALTLHLAQMSQDLTTFLETMQKAAACASLGFAVQLNTGKVFIMGESIVNAEKIVQFRVLLDDGTEADTGKMLDDAQGATVVFKGDYGRPLYEFTGGVSAIEALLAED
jgi:hypothetical protein